MLWACASTLSARALVQVVEHVPVVIAYQESDEHTAEEQEQFAAAERDLRRIAAFAGLALQKEKAHVPVELTRLVVTLHDQALLQLAFTPSVSDAVLKLCIDYFLAKAPDFDYICTQMVRTLNTVESAVDATAPKC